MKNIAILLIGILVLSGCASLPEKELTINLKTGEIQKYTYSPVFDETIKCKKIKANIDSYHLADCNNGKDYFLDEMIKQPVPFKQEQT